MAKPFFVQGLSTILTSVLIAQFAFADFAMAQTFPPVTPNTGNPTTDPFWSNTANTGLPSNPNQSPFWFNAPANPTDPTQPSSNDPWGGWTDPSNSGGWNNSGPTGDWSNMNDPYSSLNNYWGTNTISQPNPTDPFSVQIVKWMTLTSKNYALQTMADRKRYGAYSSEDNDALADIIIHNYSVQAGRGGAAASVIMLLINYLQANASSATGLGWGYGSGMALGGLAEFINVINSEANMMFELQEVYGSISDDPDERTAQALLPFYLGAMGGGISQWLTRSLGLTGPVIPIPNPPIPPDPNPNPNPDPNPNPAPAAKASARARTQKSIGQRVAKQNETKEAAVAAENGQIRNELEHSPGAQVVEEGLFKRLRKAVRPQARFVRAQGAAPLADLDAASMKMATETNLAAKLEMKAPKLNIILGKDWAPKFIKSLPAATRILMAIAINYEVDYWSCHLFGQWAKYAYSPLHKFKLAKAISMIRVNPRAKTTLWLLMLRDFLPNMDKDDAKMYATILLKEVPLVRNSKDDELKQMLADFQADPKLIDEDLAALRYDYSFPESAKLHFVKLLYAAALMRGYPSDHELKSVDTVAVGLGLMPPAQLASQAQQLEMQNPGDPRVVTKDRYQDMIFLMNKAANKTQFVQTPDQIQEQQHGSLYNGFHGLAYHYGFTEIPPIKKPKGYVVAQKWRSGQIILQDYRESGVADTVELLDEIHANQGLINPALQQKTQTVANELTKPPVGTPPVPPLQPNQLQPPVSTNVPGVKANTGQANGGTQPAGTQSQQPSFPNSPNSNGALDQFPDWGDPQTPATAPTGSQQPKQSAPIPAAPKPPTGTAGTAGGTHT